MVARIEPVARRSRSASLVVLGFAAGVGWLASCGHGGGNPASGGSPGTPDLLNTSLYAASYENVFTAGSVVSIGGVAMLTVQNGVEAWMVANMPGFVPLDREGVFFSARASVFAVDPTIVYEVGLGEGRAGSGFGFLIDGDVLRGFVSAAGVGSEVDLATQVVPYAWHDLLAVRGATSVEFFLDGVSRGTLPVPGTWPLALPPYALKGVPAPASMAFGGLNVAALSVGIPRG